MRAKFSPRKLGKIKFPRSGKVVEKFFTKSFRLVPLSPQTDITNLKFHYFKVWRHTWKMSPQITKIQFFLCFSHPTAKRPRILPDLRSKNLLVRVSLRNSFKSGKSTLNPFFPCLQTFQTKINPSAIPQSIGSQNSGSKRLNPAMFSVGQSDAMFLFSPLALRSKWRDVPFLPTGTPHPRGPSPKRCQEMSKS